MGRHQHPLAPKPTHPKSLPRASSHIGLPICVVHEHIPVPRAVPGALWLHGAGGCCPCGEELIHHRISSTRVSQEEAPWARGGRKLVVPPTHRCHPLPLVPTLISPLLGPQEQTKPLCSVSGRCRVLSRAALVMRVSLYRYKTKEEGNPVCATLAPRRSPSTIPIRTSARAPRGGGFSAGVPLSHRGAEPGLRGGDTRTLM